MMHNPLPSRDEALSKGQDGIKRSSEHTGDEWLNMAKAFLRNYCETNSLIFCDEVWEAGLARPESPRAFGAVIKHAIKNDWMVQTGQARPSVQSNMGLRMVYSSLLCAHPHPETDVEHIRDAVRQVIVELDAAADQLDEQGPIDGPASKDNGWLHKYELAANATRYARDKLEDILK